MIGLGRGEGATEPLGGFAGCGVESVANHTPDLSDL